MTDNIYIRFGHMFSSNSCDAKEK